MKNTTKKTLVAFATTLLVAGTITAHAAEPGSNFAAYEAKRAAQNAAVAQASEDFVEYTHTQSTQNDRKEGSSKLLFIAGGVTIAYFVGKKAKKDNKNTDPVEDLKKAKAETNSDEELVVAEEE